MKKTLLALLTILTALSVCACKGDSAYEIAVRNGFSGSEVEWLESLKGENGKDGKDGKDGQDGKDGKDGSSYDGFFVPGQEITFEWIDIKIPNKWSGVGSSRLISEYSPYKNINCKLTLVATATHTDKEILQALSDGRPSSQINRYEYHYKIEITGSSENAGLPVPTVYFRNLPDFPSITFWSRNEYYILYNIYPFFDQNGSFFFEGEIAFVLPVSSSSLILYNINY